MSQAIATKEGHAEHRRTVRFDWSQTPLHWVPDDPFSTHLINVLHLLLPAGERWFIQVVNEASRYIEDDPELKQAIRPFVQQEAWHAMAHTAVLDHLAEYGVDTQPYTERLKTMFNKLGDEKPHWPRPLRRWWLHRRLADVAALEHFTAVLGEWVLQTRGLDDAGADPVMLDLLRWHGAEEIEHRSLVFDVYQHLSGSYPLRAISMLLTAPQFIGWWGAGVWYLMTRDPTITATPRWRDWLRAARQYRAPGPWKLMVTTPLRYIRPNHHPVTEASTHTALRYLEHSPAAQAARDG